MNYAIDRISLDVHSSVSQGVLHWKKGDRARRIEASFMENGKPYILNSDCRISFYAEKPDGTVIFNTAYNKDEHDIGSVIVYDIAGDETAVPGQLRCEFRIYGLGDMLLTSPRFTVIVDETVYDEDAIVSENKETFLTGIINDMLEVKAETVAVVNEVQTKLDNGDFIGEKGDSFKYEDFTEEQLADLKGEPGKSAYESALDGGYDGTEEEFNEDLANVGKNGGADLSDTVPLMNGEASAGVAETAARADHVHPTDTTRMPAISEMVSLMNPDKSDRFIVYDYDAGKMKYTAWTRIVSLIASSVDKVAESDYASLARGLLAPDSDDYYAALPKGMTEDGVIALVSDIAPAVEDALAQAKASGEFDGKDGSRWFSGTQVSIDGGFPVYMIAGAKTGDYYWNIYTGDVYKAGETYWEYEGNIKGDPYTLTESDKSELVADVLAALPSWEGGSY